MPQQLPSCARDAPHEAWLPPPHGELPAAGALAPCERDEPLAGGRQLRDGSLLRDDAWRHARGALLLCDGVLRLPETYAFSLTTISGRRGDCLVAVKRT